MDDHFFFWAKSSSSIGLGHPVAYHSLDVGAVALVLLESGSVNLPTLGQEPFSTLSIAALVSLHDIGKFSRPFQAKSEPLWPHCLGTFPGQVAGPRHDTAGALMLLEPLADVLDPLLPDWNTEERGVVIRSVCGHHGRPPENPSMPQVLRDPACEQAARAFAANVTHLLGATPLPRLAGGALMAFGWWLAGLTVLADWIGSDAAAFPPRAADMDMAAYWSTVARPAARAAVAAAGVMPSRPRQVVSVSDLAGRDVQPTPLQKALQSIDLTDPAPLLAIVEDQTGSGKTEAALLLAHRLMAAARSQGLYVALPTMATANAMYARLHGAYHRLFGDGEQPSLALAHGRRMDNPAFRDSILDAAAIHAGRDDADDPADQTATAQCAAWIADNRKRIFLAAIGVGTIDQALLAVLPSRHAPLRLLGLSARVLIVDEAHAYDPYMAEELAALVTFQTALGGNTIILSATLTAAQRARLVRAHQEGAGLSKKEGERPVRADYPQITLAQGKKVIEQVCAPRPRLARRVLVEREDTIEAVVARIAAAAARGDAVAWIRNTVDDAIEARDRLAEAGIDALLFHARFAMGHRLEIEQRVMEKFGKDAKDRSGVVVATQVIEQSLDLDFDFMVSDLAPIDLLIQRAGRLWRHDRGPRLAGAPRLLLFSPAAVAEPGADWLAGAWRGTSFVYPRIDVLWRSARALAQAGCIDTPGDVRRLVESVYAPEDATPAGLERCSCDAEGKERSHRRQAEINVLKFDAGYCRNAGAWDTEDRTPTRLGEETITLRLAVWDGAVLRPVCEADTARRAWSLSEVSVRRGLCSGVPEPAPAVGRALAEVAAAWKAWERDIPVLVLEGKGALTARGLDKAGPIGTLAYDAENGLRRAAGSQR